MAIASEQPQQKQKLIIFDTSLRDGEQVELYMCLCA